MRKAKAAHAPILPDECTAMLAVEKLQPCPEQWYAKVLARDQSLAFRTCNKPKTHLGPSSVRKTAGTSANHGLKPAQLLARID